MTTAVATEEPAKILPSLRRDLSFDLMAVVMGQFPALSIRDDIRGMYFRVEWPQSGLFLLWREAGSVAELVQLMATTYGVALSDDDIKRAIEFAVKHELTETDEKGGWQRYAALESACKYGLAKTLLHQYLFFRVPLLRPDRSLRRMLPYFSFAFRKAFWFGVAMFAVLATYVASRQWADVEAAFAQSMQFHNLFIFAAALLALKAVHELGHALTTVYYGCRVPSMGVAVMLGAPVLYTDTSDSWRLSRHRDRLRIVFAGVAAESVIATLALCLWNVLPDGPVRQVCFGLATAAIAMSLAVNLNPFMRFDGYFALSDYLQIPNLQARSFDLAAWYMRASLFGLSDPPPETVEPGKLHVLIVYAYLTWIYRLSLYLGIAALVYVFAGKAIGIFLGLVEIYVFIFRPIWSELVSWWKLKTQIASSRRGVLSIGVFGCGVVMLCVPWSGTIDSPAVLAAAVEQELHLPVPARITKVFVHLGESVHSGQLLFEAVSPDVEHKLHIARLRDRLLELRLSRLLSNDTDLDQSLVLKREYKLSREKIAGLERQRRELRITAPFDGKFVDADAAAVAGVWVDPEVMLGRVTSAGASRVHAVIADTDLPRLEMGAAGTFIADQADLKAFDVILDTIAPANNGKLAEAVLADVNGGEIGTVTQDRTLRPRSGWVEVGYATDYLAPTSLIRGVVRVKAKPVSPLAVMWQQVGRVFVREQGF